MKNAVVYTFDRSSMFDKFSSPTRKHGLLKELEEIDGWIYDIDEVITLGVKVDSHKLPVTDEVFNILAKEWDRHFEDSSMTDMLLVYCLPEAVLKSALEKLKGVKDPIGLKVVFFLLGLPKETVVLIEPQKVEND